MQFFHPDGFVRAREMVEYVGDALEVLLDEGRRGQGRLLNLGFHLRIAGRPARFAAFRDILALLARHEGAIWLSRRADIAHAFRAAIPA